MEGDMEITYSNIKNIDQNSTAGSVVRYRGLVTRKISPREDISSETTLIIPKKKKLRKRKKISTPSPIPVSE